MKFKIYGVSRDSGKDVELVLEADNKEAAEKAAYDLNILVYVQKTQEVVEHEIKAAAPVVRREEARQGDQLQSAQSPQQHHSQQPLPTLNVNVKSNSNSLGIAAIILGVVALFICWIPFVGLISLAFAGVGLVLSLVGLGLSIKRGGQGIGYPIAGIVLNGLPLAIVLLITSAFVTAFSHLNDVVSSNENSMPLPQQSPSETDFGNKNEVKPNEIIFPTLSNKRVEGRIREGDYDYANFWWDITYRAQNLSKTARSIKGVLVLGDLFGEAKIRVRCTINENLLPGGSVHISGGVESSHFDDYHNWLLTTDLKDMQFWFVVDSILYEDGERKDY